jgi:hypothetical protein
MEDMDDMDFGYHMRDMGAMRRNGVTTQVDRLKAEGF